MDDLPDNIEFDEDAAAVLQELWQNEPEIAAGVEAACSIISTFAGDQELRPLIQRYQVLYKSGYRVFRYKDKKNLDEWRIFFYLLDNTEPRVVMVAALVKYESDETYDNLTMPHVRQIRTAYLQHQAEGLIRRR